MLNPGQVVNNRYEVIRVIGKGGMSTVYQATDRISGKLLAIKDVPRNRGEDGALIEKTLISEGNMLKGLSNPHLPKVYDFIINPENYLLVMDFVSGESLDRRIAREGPQPVLWVLNWGMQICEVFDYLHNQPVPIIYRDMKPANVILQPDGHLMMIDFGTARTQKTNLEMAADTICFGTAGFAAPEQFGGIGQSTPRTDIFCLGGTLYNMVTGHSPCDRPQGILPLENWNPALKDSPLSYIITKCTRNDPNERYQTARELYEDLDRASKGTFVPPSNMVPGGKPAATWQKQKVKASGLTSGLSGLLKGKNASQKTPPAQQPSQNQQSAQGWQHQSVQNPVAQQPQPYQHFQGQQPTPVQQPQQYQQIPNQVPYSQYAEQSNGGWPNQAYASYDAGSPVAVEAPAESVTHPWRKLTILGIIVAVLMMIIGCVCMMFSFVGGLIFTAIALFGVILALVGAVKTKKAES